MSFGFSISDVLALAQLVKRTHDGWKRACGQYARFTNDLRVLGVVIGRVETEASAKDSVFIRNEQDLRGWETISRECSSVVTELEAILNKYNGLGKSRRRNWDGIRQHWDRLRIGSHSFTELERRLININTSLSAYLAVLGIGSQTRIVNDLLPEIIQKVDGIAAQIRKGNSTIRSSMTRYDNDETAVWREFRRDLVNSGFRSSDLRQYSAALKTYLWRLQREGLLDEPEPESKDPSISMPNHSSAISPSVDTWISSLAVEQLDDAFRKDLHEMPATLNSMPTLDEVSDSDATSESTVRDHDEECRRAGAGASQDQQTSKSSNEHSEETVKSTTAHTNRLQDQGIPVLKAALDTGVDQKSGQDGADCEEIDTESQEPTLSNRLLVSGDTRTVVAQEANADSSNSLSRIRVESKTGDEEVVNDGTAGTTSDPLECKTDLQTPQLEKTLFNQASNESLRVLAQERPQHEARIKRPSSHRAPNVENVQDQGEENMQEQGTYVRSSPLDLEEQPTGRRSPRPYSAEPEGSAEEHEYLAPLDDNIGGTSGATTAPSFSPGRPSGYTWISIPRSNPHHDLSATGSNESSKVHPEANPSPSRSQARSSFRHPGPVLYGQKQPAIPKLQRADTMPSIFEREERSRGDSPAAIVRKVRAVETSAQPKAPVQSISSSSDRPWDARTGTDMRYSTMLEDALHYQATAKQKASSSRPQEPKTINRVSRDKLYGEMPSGSTGKRGMRPTSDEQYIYLVKPYSRDDVKFSSGKRGARPKSYEKDDITFKRAYSPDDVEFSSGHSKKSASMSPTAIY